MDSGPPVLFWDSPDMHPDIPQTSPRTGPDQSGPTPDSRPHLARAQNSAISNKISHRLGQKTVPSRTTAAPPQAPSGPRLRNRSTPSKTSLTLFHCSQQRGLFALYRGGAGCSTVGCSPKDIYAQKLVRACMSI